MVYSLFCLLAISHCFVIGTGANEALIGGDDAGEYQFPYEVSVQIKEGILHCGGGIISAKSILTAAHCVVNDDGHIDAGPFYIVAASNDLRKPVKNKFVPNVKKRGIRVRVKKIFVPRNYDSKDVKSLHDIAVLRLKEPLKIGKSKRLEQLILPPKNTNDAYTGKMAMFAGFGWSEIFTMNGKEMGGNRGKLLRWAKVDVLNNHSRHTDPFRQLIARVQQRKDTVRGVCYGDSGGPLVYGKMVIGVLSMTPPGCTERSKGAVYTRVSRYMDFVEHAMKNLPHHDIITRDV